MSEAIITNEQAEAVALARHLGKNYRASLEYYKQQNRKNGKFNREEEAQQAEEGAAQMRNPTDAHAERIHATPLDQIDWFDIETLEQNEEGKGWEKWQAIKEAARAELRSGVFGVDAAVSSNAFPLRRAQYAVLREEMIRQWQPRDFIEQTLIEQLAQTYLLYLNWMGVCVNRSHREMQELTKQEAFYEAPRVSKEKADEHAVMMTERCHRLFLRTLRALRDMRRYAPVIITNAGQVNVAGQQINVAEIEK